MRKTSNPLRSLHLFKHPLLSHCGTALPKANSSITPQSNINDQLDKTGEYGHSATSLEAHTQHGSLPSPRSHKAKMSQENLEQEPLLAPLLIFLPHLRISNFQDKSIKRIKGTQIFKPSSPLLTTRMQFLRLTCLPSNDNTLRLNYCTSSSTHVHPVNGQQSFHVTTSKALLYKNAPITAAHENDNPMLTSYLTRKKTGNNIFNNTNSEGKIPLIAN